MPAAEFDMSLGWFKQVQCGSTRPNLIESLNTRWNKFDMSSGWLGSRGHKDNMRISDEFSVVQLSQTSSYLSTAEVARPGVVLDMRLGWFNPTEPHRTTELQRVQGY